MSHIRRRECKIYIYIYIYIYTPKTIKMEHLIKTRRKKKLVEYKTYFSMVSRGEASPPTSATYFHITRSVIRQRF